MERSDLRLKERDMPKIPTIEHILKVKRDTHHMHYTYLLEELWCNNLNECFLIDNFEVSKQRIEVIEVARRG